MEPIQAAFIHRARSALDTAMGTTAMPGAHAKAFIEAARAIGAGGEGRERASMAGSTNHLVEKAVAANTHEAIWTGDDARALASAYIASIAELSLLDQIAKYARVLPATQRRVMLASGFTADVVAEAAPKVVRSLVLSVDPEAAKKIAAIVVTTKELLMATDAESQALFAAELERAVLRGMNQAAIDVLVDSGTLTIGATGDPLADLRAGLRAAGPSNGYVVAMPSGDAGDLATRAENRGGMTVRGGTFVPGVEVVGIDDATAMTIIPASRLALYLTSLELRASGEGDISMADSPTAPSAMVSLWQSNSAGLICERSFHLSGDKSGVVQVMGS